MQDEKATFPIRPAPGPGQAVIQALPVQFTPLIALSQAEMTLVRAQAHWLLGLLILAQGELARAKELFWESLAVARHIGDTQQVAQMAEQLVISPHTVNTHLKSIYGKIRVSSRSAATRYAIEHQLL